MTKKKRLIMLIDDHIEFLKEFQEMLQLCGYETRGFSNGEKALNSVKKVKPDLIMLDLKMDGKSGFDVAKDLKSDPQTENIPIIIVTSFSTDQDCELLIERFKVKKIIQKPFKPQDILMEVEKVFEDVTKNNKY